MKKIILLVVVLLLLASLERKPSMAIDFTHTSDQAVDFGALSTVQGWSSKTMIAWVDMDTTADGAIMNMYAALISDEAWYIYMAGAKVNFWANWSGGVGIWETSSTISSGRHQIAVSYSGSSTSNNPVIYIDGSSVSVTKLFSPSGSFSTGTTNRMQLGAANAGDTSFDGRINAAFVYNRILSAGEILDTYNSRLVVPDYRGLVFAPAIWAGGADGSTVTTIIDHINGASGTASGSPVFKQDTYLTFK